MGYKDQTETRTSQPRSSPINSFINKPTPRMISYRILLVHPFYGRSLPAKGQRLPGRQRTDHDLRKHSGHGGGDSRSRPSHQGTRR